MDCTKEEFLHQVTDYKVPSIVEKMLLMAHKNTMKLKNVVPHDVTQDAMYQTLGQLSMMRLHNSSLLKDIADIWFDILKLSRDPPPPPHLWLAFTFMENLDSTVRASFACADINDFHVKYHQLMISLFTDILA